MGNADLARRGDFKVSFDGVNITSSLKPYLLDISYTDNESGTSDDLQIRIQDRDSLWLENWLTEAIEGACAAKLKIHADIIRQNWKGNGSDETIPCGEFELDSVNVSGPPSEITIKASSLPFSAAIRQTLKSKSWENYTLSGIAGEMASNNGMSLRYDASTNPQYEKMEQTATSDISFLYKLCTDAGLALKATGTEIVIFDQKQYESQAEVMTIKRKKVEDSFTAQYLNYKLSTGSAGKKYTSCRVSWVNKEGELIEGIAKTDDYNDEAKNNQQLEIKELVKTAAEAKTLAEKRLRHVNLFSRTADFTFPLEPVLAAGVTVVLQGFGGFDGKYLVTQVKHQVSPGSGSTTSAQLRSVLEGY